MIIKREGYSIKGSVFNGVIVNEKFLLGVIVCFVVLIFFLIFFKIEISVLNIFEYEFVVYESIFINNRFWVDYVIFLGFLIVWFYIVTLDVYVVK